MNTSGRQNINHFWVAGINYKKTDVAVRGMFAVNNDQYRQLVSLAPSYGISEFFILSTCNRTEIYGFADSFSQLAGLLCNVSPGSEHIFGQLSYKKKGPKAIEHLFEVGAGLDSQILGDYEILGQIKNAAKNAKAAGFVGPFTERLVNSVLQASKAVKTHTALSGGTVSVAFAAVQFIREYIEGPEFTPQMKCPASEHIMSAPVSAHYEQPVSVNDKKILLVGTGKIGRSACRNLVDYLGATNITLVNRTEETATALARELGLRSAPISSLEHEVADADIILVSVSANEPVMAAGFLAGKGEKLIIDFSIPCNVDAAAQALSNVTYVDVDRLSKIKDETLEQRRAEIPKAVAIINELVADFMDWYDMRKHVPVLKEVKSKLKGIASDGNVCDAVTGDEEKIHKVIGSLAVKMRNTNTAGCNYIQAINEFIA